MFHTKFDPYRKGRCLRQIVKDLHPVGLVLLSKATYTINLLAHLTSNWGGMLWISRSKFYTLRRPRCCSCRRTAGRPCWLLDACRRAEISSLGPSFRVRRPSRASGTHPCLSASGLDVAVFWIRGTLSLHPRPWYLRITWISGWIERHGSCICARVRRQRKVEISGSSFREPSYYFVICSTFQDASTMCSSILRYFDRCECLKAYQLARRIVTEMKFNLAHKSIWNYDQS